MNALHDIEWDSGNDYFPPTSFQVVDIRSGTGASNVTPAELSARFNFRYSTEWRYTELQARVEQLFSTYDLKYTIDWHLSGEPFLTQPGALIDAVVAAVEERTNERPELSTGGGTSDGRFIAPAGVDVVELGPVNASIHKVNEHVRIDDVTTLKHLYFDVMDRLLGAKSNSVA